MSLIFIGVAFYWALPLSPPHPPCGKEVYIYFGIYNSGFLDLCCVFLVETSLGLDIREMGCSFWSDTGKKRVLHNHKCIWWWAGFNVPPNLTGVSVEFGYPMSLPEPFDPNPWQRLFPGNICCTSCNCCDWYWNPSGIGWYFPLIFWYVTCGKNHNDSCIQRYRTPQSLI